MSCKFCVYWGDIPNRVGTHGECRINPETILVDEKYMCSRFVMRTNEYSDGSMMFEIWESQKRKAAICRELWDKNTSLKKNVVRLRKKVRDLKAIK